MTTLPPARRYFRYRLDNDREGTAILQDNTIFVYEDNTLKKFPRRFDTWAKCEPGEIDTEKVKQTISIAKAHALMGDVAPLVKSVGEPLLHPGEYHPRIWRQATGPSPHIYGREYTDCLVAFQNLERDLSELFRTLEPDARNDNAYGHRVRELLILACTEVENQLKGVLKSNGGSGDKMPHYFKVVPAFQLNEWKVKLKQYADYPAIAPFSDWAIAPGQTDVTSPFWYRAYNKAKHDRASAFHQANLSATINAVAAVGVLIMAQFGAALTHNPFRPDNFRMEQIRLEWRPDYPLEKGYIPDIDGGGWNPVQHNF